MSLSTKELSDAATTKAREAAEAASERARGLGADGAEIAWSHARVQSVDLQNGDVLGATSAAESTFGVRALVGKGLGFTTVNRPEDVPSALEEAIALAKLSPPDEHEDLVEPSSEAAIESLTGRFDEALVEFPLDRVVSIAQQALRDIAARDARVRVDSGSVSVSVGSSGVVSTKGIRCEDRGTAIGSGFFGMAVDGEEVASFDADGHSQRGIAGFEAGLAAAVERFVTKTTGALGATAGESFKGPVVLAPEVVGDFLLGDLLAMISARSVRTGRSPFGDKLGEIIAHESLSLRDDPHRDHALGSRRYDREGIPTRPVDLLRDGRLGTFLYNGYEARRAGVAPTGHATGGAGGPPRIGTSNLILEPGQQSFASLCSEPARTVVVSRFSGTSSPVTGEFSGVVKGGFLVEKGERRPIKETMISGNLLDALRGVDGIASEVRELSGRAWLPGLRIDGINVTAG